MRIFNWDQAKNEKLKMERGVSFEEIVLLIEQDTDVNIIDHPNPEKYPNQKIFIILLKNYIYIVPFIKREEEYFLKTIIPSRKATKRYLSKGDKL